MIANLIILSGVFLIRVVLSSTDDSSGSFLNNVILESAVDVYTLKSSAARLKDGCRKQSENYFYALKNKTEWALQMYDASSKLQPGIITGNLVDLGSFDECLAVKATTDVGRVTGKYCLATINYKNNNAAPAATGQFQDDNNLLDLFFLSEKELNRTIAVGVKTNPVESKWSICVPDACSYSDVEAHLAVVFRNFTVRINRNDCQTLAGQPKLTTGSWTYIAILIAISLISISSTVYDINLRKNAHKPKNALFLAFSIYTNGEKLTAVKKVAAGHMGCLDGIRFISAVWVVLLHRHDTALREPLLNGLYSQQRLSTADNSVFIGSCLVVDTFFLMSSCLLMQSFLRSNSKGIPSNIPLQILHRYLRLTPVVIATAVFFATLLIHVGSGPLWLSNIEKEQNTCRDYWWSTILYVQNYVNPYEMCMNHLWYLCVDMHLFIVSVVLFKVVWWKWEKHALRIFYALVVLFVVVPFYVTWKNQTKIYHYKTAQSSWWAAYYCSALTRGAPWFVGLALGCILHENGKRPNKLVLQKWLVAVCWILAAVGSFCAVFVEYPINQPDHQYNRLLESILYGTHRAVWSIAVSWLIFACINGYGGPINSFLSLPVFQVLGRLSFSMYVTHYIVILGFKNSTRTTQYLSNANIIHQLLGDVCLTLVISVFCVLMFEMPAGAIDTLLFKQDQKKPAKSKNHNASSTSTKIEVDNPAFLTNEKL